MCGLCWQSVGFWGAYKLRLSVALLLPRMVTIEIMIQRLHDFFNTHPPTRHTDVTTTSTITIIPSCPRGHMARGLGSIIEPLWLHQFLQCTILFTRSSERGRLARFNWVCIKSNRICLAEIDSVTRRGYKWTTFPLVTHVHQLEWKGKTDKDDGEKQTLFEKEVHCMQ